MSDQRFDDDLRSVLLDDAPREVPDDLRRRIMAIPSTHPVAVHVPRPTWRYPLPMSIGAAAVVVMALLLASWWFGFAVRPDLGGDPTPVTSVGPSTAPSPPTPASPTPSPTPVRSNSPSPSPVPSPSPSPSTTPSSTVPAGLCRAAELGATILGWQGAAGSRIADIEVTDLAARSCVVRGTPGLQLLDADGKVLIDSATAGPSGQPHVSPTDATFQLAAGARLHTEVQASNFCGAAPSLPIDIAITLPSGAGTLVARPGPGVSSADAVPPCLGPTGSQIAMNGWRR